MSHTCVSVLTNICLPSIDNGQQEKRVVPVSMVCEICQSGIGEARHVHTLTSLPATASEASCIGR